MVDRGGSARANGTAGRAAGQANRVAAPSGAERQAGDTLSPCIESEIHDALARVLSRHKAETVAAECGVDRATIYKWQAKPRRVPVAALATLAHFDADPEFLARVAGHLLSAVAQSALARHAAGGCVTVFHEVAPGRWGR